MPELLTPASSGIAAVKANNHPKQLISNYVINSQLLAASGNPIIGILHMQLNLQTASNIIANTINIALKIILKG